MSAGVLFVEHCTASTVSCSLLFHRLSIDNIPLSSTACPSMDGYGFCPLDDFVCHTPVVLNCKQKRRRNPENKKSNPNAKDFGSFQNKHQLNQLAACLKGSH